MYKQFKIGGFLMKHFTQLSSSLLLAGGLILSMGSSASVISVSPGSLTQCPIVGSATSCAAVYRFNADGSVDTLVDSSISSTDDLEDTLVGVQNNSGHTINSLSLSGVGTSGLGVFDFDDDGESAISNPGSGPGDTYFGQYFDSAAALLGTTSFDNISTVSVSNDTGRVNFAGLTNGGYGWWVLEDQISFSAPPTVAGSVPEPAEIALFGIGLLGFEGMRRRKV